jgi:hypothetical protein
VDQTPGDLAAAESNQAAIKDRRRRAIIGISVAVFVLLLVLFMTWKFLQRPVPTEQLQAADTISTESSPVASAIATDSGLSTVPPDTATATESVVPTTTVDNGSSTTAPSSPAAPTPINPASSTTKASTTTKPAVTYTKTTTSNTTVNSNTGSTTNTTVSYPNTSLVVKPSSPNGANGWYRTRPAISFSPSGRRTYYRWKTWGSWYRYTGPVYAPDGDHTLQYYSYKPNGVRQAASTKNIMVDRTKPSVPGNLKIISATEDGVVLSWDKSTDSHSGMACYEVVANDGTKKATATGTSATFPMIALGSAHKFGVRAVDVAGNRSGYSNIVALAPTTMMVTTPANPDGANGWFRNPPTISLMSNESGVTYYALDGQVGYTTYVSPFTINTPGAHSLRFYSENGLAETEKSASIKLDSVAPPAPPAPSVVASGTTVLHISWPTVADVEPGSGLARYELLDFRSDGTHTSYMVTPSGSSPQTYTVSDPGGFTGRSFQVVAVDNAGNRSSSVLTPAATSAGNRKITKTSSTRTPGTAPTSEFTRPTFGEQTPGLVSTPIGNPPAAPPEAKALDGTFYDIKPSSPLSGNATIVLYYDPADLPEPDTEVRMMHYTGGQWVDITTEVDTVNHRVSGVTNSFSPFGLFGEPHYHSPASSWQSLLALGAFVLLLAVWSVRRRPVRVEA